MSITPSDKRATTGSGHVSSTPAPNGALDRRLPSVAVPGEERGAVLLIMAVLIVLLLGVVGFAVDLGWAFWNGLEIQHGADSTTWSARIAGRPVHLTE